MAAAGWRVSVPAASAGAAAVWWTTAIRAGIAAADGANAAAAGGGEDFSFVFEVLLHSHVGPICRVNSLKKIWDAGSSATGWYKIWIWSMCRITGSRNFEGLLWSDMVKG